MLVVDDVAKLGVAADYASGLVPLWLARVLFGASSSLLLCCPAR
jgi:hypothetical protein